MDLPCPDGLPPADLLARADALRDARAWADAAELYADYLRRNPGHWQIWVQYGHCTKECGDPETALLLLPGGGAAAAGGLRPPVAPGPRAETPGPAGGGLRGLRPRLGPRPRQRLRPGRIARLAAAAGRGAGRGRGLRLRRLRPAGLRAARPGADRHPAGPVQPHRALLARRPSRSRGRRLRPGQRRLEADPARRVRAPGRPGAERRRPGRAGMEGRGWRGAGCRAARAGARIRARRRPGHPRHRLVDPELPAARAGSEGAVRPPLRAVHPRLHPRPGAGTLRRRAWPPNSPLGSPVPASTPTRCWRTPTARATTCCACGGACFRTPRTSPPRCCRSMPGHCCPVRALPPPVRARRRRTAGPMCSSSPPSRAARTTCWCSTPGLP